MSFADVPKLDTTSRPIESAISRIQKLKYRKPTASASSGDNEISESVQKHVATKLQEALQELGTF